MKNEKNYMGFRIPKVWQILKHFTGAFHRAQTSYFWRLKRPIAIAKIFSKKKRLELEKKNPMSDVIVQVQLRLKSVYVGDALALLALEASLLEAIKSGVSASPLFPSIKTFRCFLLYSRPAGRGYSPHNGVATAEKKILYTLPSLALCY